ncbi:MAG: hypothetical protein ACKOHI_12750, partial [Phycisphaerales bacterium]
MARPSSANSRSRASTPQNPPLPPPAAAISAVSSAYWVATMRRSQIDMRNATNTADTMPPQTLST